MKKSKNHKGSKLQKLWLLAAFLPIYLFGQDTSGDAAKGKDLFKANCAACHKLDGKLVGPPLGGITEKKSAEWLHKWIKNSKALIDAGDKDAIAIFEEYDKVPMLAYDGILSDGDIDNVLAYIADPSKAEAAAPATPAATDTPATATPATATASADTPAAAPTAPKGKGSLALVLGIASAALLLIFLAIVFKTNREIKRLAKENNQEDQLSALFSGENENTTGENLTGTLSANAEEAELTGEKASEPEFIVEIASDKNEKSDSEEALITKNNNQKEIAALQARVEALEYHLLMLMQSLKQPQTQPTGIPMKYPVWNYSLQN